MTFILGLLACKSDIELHQAALAAGSSANCLPIQDPEMKGDCLAWKARKQAEAEDLEGAASTCGSVTLPLWQSECWFMVSDASHAKGREAVVLCSLAGGFEEECLGHALSRSLEQQLTIPGNETAAYAELEDAWMSLYQDPARARLKADSMFVSALLRRPRPYSHGSFGNSPDRLRKQVLAAHIQARHCSLHGVDVSSLGSLVKQAWETTECGPYPEEIPRP